MATKPKSITTAEQNINPSSHLYSAPFFSNNNGLVYSAGSNWGNNVNMIGVKPPKPNLNFYNQIPYSSLPEPIVSQRFNLLKINSNRAPYATEYLVNGYGSNVVPRFGTDMGR